MSEVSKDFEIPNDLSDLGRQVAETIVKTIRHLVGDSVTGGGCKAFYSPEEWQDRGEQYGLSSELIVVYDGGDLSSCFSYLSGLPEFEEAMTKALEDIGVWAEPCTCWYSAVYKS
jgi:hypothetical protein